MHCIEVIIHPAGPIGSKHTRTMNSLRTILIPLVNVLLFVLASAVSAQYECGGVVSPVIPLSQVCTTNGSDWTNIYRHQGRYIVGEPLNPGATKSIKIAIHIWQDNSGGNNYPDNQATRDMLTEGYRFV